MKERVFTWVSSGVGELQEMLRDGDVYNMSTGEVEALYSLDLDDGGLNRLAYIFPCWRTEVLTGEILGKAWSHFVYHRQTNTLGVENGEAFCIRLARLRLTPQLAQSIASREEIWWSHHILMQVLSESQDPMVNPEIALRLGSMGAGQVALRALVLKLGTSEKEMNALRLGLEAWHRRGTHNSPGCWERVGDDLLGNDAEHVAEFYASLSKEKRVLLGKRMLALLLTGDDREAKTWLYSHLTDLRNDLYSVPNQVPTCGPDIIR